MDGGDGHDVMLGDNGQITRPVTAGHFNRATPGTPAGTRRVAGSPLVGIDARRASRPTPTV